MVELYGIPKPIQTHLGGFRDDFRCLSGLVHGLGFKAFRVSDEVRPQTPRWSLRRPLQPRTGCWPWLRPAWSLRLSEVFSGLFWRFGRVSNGCFTDCTWVASMEPTSITCQDYRAMPVPKGRVQVVLVSLRRGLSSCKLS